MGHRVHSVATPPGLLVLVILWSTLVAAPALALPVTVTFNITSGFADNGGVATNGPIQSGSLVVTWPNAFRLYYATNPITGTVNFLSLVQSGVGTLTLMNLKLGTPTCCNSAFLRTATSGGTGSPPFALVTGMYPFLVYSPISFVTFRFTAAGSASVPRSYLMGSLSLVGSTTIRWSFQGFEVGRIPEPSSFPLLGLGLGALGVYQASRRGARRLRRNS